MVQYSPCRCLPSADKIANHYHNGFYWPNMLYLVTNGDMRRFQNIQDSYNQLRIKQQYD